MRSVQQDRDGTRTISASFDGTSATLFRGSGVSITKQGPGVFLLRFPALKTIINALVSVYAGAGQYTATCSINSDGSVQVWSWYGTTLSDMGVGIQVTGFPK